MINAYRADNGLGALTLSATLGAAARYHSRDNMLRDALSHPLVNGATATRNMANHGYPTSTTATGEIIYRGYGLPTNGIHQASAQAAFTWWKNGRITTN